MDEEKLIHKLRLLEALRLGGATEGERAAAGLARERLLKKLAELERTEPPIEYRISLADGWSRKLFTAICRRYEIRTYRYRRQQHTTVMVRVPKSFMDDTLWPEYVAFSEELTRYLAEVTDRVIATVFEAPSEDVEVRNEPEQLLLET